MAELAAESHIALHASRAAVPASTSKFPADTQPSQRYQLFLDFQRHSKFTPNAQKLSPAAYSNSPVSTKCSKTFSYCVLKQSSFHQMLNNFLLLHTQTVQFPPNAQKRSPTAYSNSPVSTKCWTTFSCCILKQSSFHQMLKNFLLRHTQTVQFPQPYLPHSPSLYISTSLSLPEGWKGTDSELSDLTTSHNRSSSHSTSLFIFLLYPLFSL